MRSDKIGRFNLVPTKCEIDPAIVLRELLGRWPRNRSAVEGPYRNGEPVPIATLGETGPYVGSRPQKPAEHGLAKEIATSKRKRIKLVTTAKFGGFCSIDPLEDSLSFFAESRKPKLKAGSKAMKRK